MTVVEPPNNPSITPLLVSGGVGVAVGLIILGLWSALLTLTYLGLFLLVVLLKTLPVKRNHFLSRNVPNIEDLPALRVVFLTSCLLLTYRAITDFLNSYSQLIWVLWDLFLVTVVSATIANSTRQEIDSRPLHPKTKLVGLIVVGTLGSLMLVFLAGVMAGVTSRTAVTFVRGGVGGSLLDVLTVVPVEGIIGWLGWMTHDWMTAGAAGVVVVAGGAVVGGLAQLIWRGTFGSDKPPAKKQANPPPTSIILLVLGNHLLLLFLPPLNHLLPTIIVGMSLAGYWYWSKQSSGSGVTHSFGVTGQTWGCLLTWLGTGLAIQHNPALTTLVSTAATLGSRMTTLSYSYSYQLVLVGVELTTVAMVWWGGEKRGVPWEQIVRAGVFLGAAGILMMELTLLERLVGLAPIVKSLVVGLLFYWFYDPKGLPSKGKNQAVIGLLPIVFL